MTTNLVQYSGYSIEQADEDAARAASISGNIYMDLEVGDNVARFIPLPLGVRGSPHRKTGMHYVDAVPGLDKTLVFACPRVELKQACPVCKESERLSRSSKPIDRERAFRIASKLRVFTCVCNRAIAKPEDSMQILAFGKMIDTGLKVIRKNTRLGGDYYNPTETGFDVVITREGTGMATSYAVAADRGESPLAPTAEVTNWLINNRPDLEKCVVPIVPEELLAAWNATSAQATAPTQRAQPGVGAAIMRTPQPAQGAVIDAEGIEYDDDYNIISRSV